MAIFTDRPWQGENSPRWLADYRSRDHLIPGPALLKATDFPITGTVVVQMNGAALAGATSLTVDQLSGPLPQGALLDFTGPGELVKLSAPAIKGATTLSVEATDAAIEDNDTATYVPPGASKRTVRAGTAIGRTITERNAGTGYGLAASTDDEIYLLAFGIEDVSEEPAGVLVRPGAVVKENLLPEVLDGTLATAVLTALRDVYVMQGGVA